MNATERWEINALISDLVYRPDEISRIELLYRVCGIAGIEGSTYAATTQWRKRYLVQRSETER